MTTEARTKTETTADGSFEVRRYSRGDPELFYLPGKAITVEFADGCRAAIRIPRRAQCVCQAILRGLGAPEIFIEGAGHVRRSEDEICRNVGVIYHGPMKGARVIF